MAKFTESFLTDLNDPIFNEPLTPVHLDLDRVSRHLNSASQDKTGEHCKESPGPSDKPLPKK